MQLSRQFICYAYLMTKNARNKVLTTTTTTTKTLWAEMSYQQPQLGQQHVLIAQTLTHTHTTTTTVATTTTTTTTKCQE